jgi:4-hydroxybenzoate polyprenyltransferase
MLLFWPCAWGLTLAYDFSSDLNNYFFYLLLFFLGAVLMRSAGCIVNDILDKEFDKKVFRTKNRPIASGKISTKIAFTYASILCLLALLVLLNFNQFTIILALVFNASCFYLSFNEKVYLLASIIFRNYV